MPAIDPRDSNIVVFHMYIAQNEGSDENKVCFLFTVFLLTNQQKNNVLYYFPLTVMVLQAAGFFLTQISIKAIANISGCPSNSLFTAL